MKRSSLVALTAALTLARAAASYGAGEAEPSLVMVVPAKYAFVKLAQDVAALRPITVVSYSATNNNAIFLWDRDGAKWSALDAASFASGTGFYVSSHMIVLGTDAGTVNLFATSAKAWATKTTSMPKFDIATVLNSASDVLHFTDGEWKWLSERYNLSLKDGNEERRKYGKYGPPGQKRSPPPKVQPAPAPDIVLPELVPPSPAPAPAPAPVVVPAAAEPAAPATPVVPAAPSAQPPAPAAPTPQPTVEPSAEKTPPPATVKPAEPPAPKTPAAEPPKAEQGRIILTP